MRVKLTALPTRLCFGPQDQDQLAFCGVEKPTNTNVLNEHATPHGTSSCGVTCCFIGGEIRGTGPSDVELERQSQLWSYGLEQPCAEAGRVLRLSGVVNEWRTHAGSVVSSRSAFSTKPTSGVFPPYRTKRRRVEDREARSQASQRVLLSRTIAWKFQTLREKDGVCEGFTSVHAHLGDE